jgi:catechol 2,3-dioxygenase-like lactoylglutathione lyase family enzyme
MQSEGAWRRSPDAAEEAFPTRSITAAEHVGFTVGDLDRSIRFYSDLLGHEPFFETIEERPYLGDVVGYPACRLRIAFFRLPNTSVFLELLEYLQPKGSRVSMETLNTGIAHLCLVVDDLDAEFTRLREIGAVFRSAAPVERADGGRAAYLRDPDGISIELQEPPE